jgi:hypothetical protein
MFLSKSQALSTTYFTKEFSGYEIESKWTLLTQNPVPTIFRFMSDLNTGLWDGFSITKTMGSLPTGFRYLELPFDFWAVPEKGKWRQVAMVAKAPWHNLFLVAFKEGRSTLFPGKEAEGINLPLLRREERKGDWISEQDTIQLIVSRFPSAQKLACMSREKASVYISHKETFRNFCISADRCSCKNRVLSQVEVEYKGRSGIWIPDTTGQFILRDFSVIHDTLVKCYGDILVPTVKTKFEWIMSA